MRQLMRYVLGLLVFAAMFAAPLAFAQSSINLRIDQLDIDAFPEVRLFASLTDAQGRSLPNLGHEHFVLLEKGRNVPIKSIGMVQPENVALRVVLALDISGSIKPGLEQIKQAAIDFVRTLKPNDQVALVFFGNRSYNVQEFTPDHNTVINSINALTLESLEEYTALYNGAFESIRLAANQGGGRRAVVVLTDGKNTLAPNSTSLTLSDVQREATDKHMLVYVIGVGSEVSDQDLRLLASSGRYYRVDQPEEVAKAYRDIAEQLRQQYELTFVSTLPPDGQVYPLELKVNVPNLGATAAAVLLQTITPKTPFVRLSLPEHMTIGEPAEIKAEIFSRNPPRSVELLLDGQLVVSEPAQGSLWAYTWAPPIALAPGDHQLDVRVTDVEGVQSAPAPQIVKLAASRIPFVRPIVPELMTIGAPVEIKAEVVSRNPLQRVELLLDGQIVASEPLTGSPWSYSWTPATTLPPGDHQLDIRVIDIEGIQSAPAPQTVKLAAQPANSGDVGWGRIAAALLVLLVLLLLGGGVVLQMRQRNKTKRLVGVPASFSPTRESRPLESPPSSRAQQAGESSNVPRAMLVVEHGKTNVNQLQLVAGREVQIGRRPTADLSLEDHRVSNQHALIRFLENSFTIIDLGSTNGTRVNGRRISQMHLQHNDRIEIGDTVLIFKQLR